MSGDTILVVDDGRDMREFVVEYVLEPNGYNSLVAEDGQQGLEIVTAEQPDLILLDLQMPRLDGIGMLKAMDERGLNIPVVLMTFHGSEEIAVEVFRLGVVNYVIKPFSLEELLGAIENALTNVRLRKERDELTERLIFSNRSLKRRVKELQALYGVGKSVSAQVGMDTLLKRVVEATAYVTGAEDTAILIVDPQSDELMKRAVKKGEDAAADYLITTMDDMAIKTLKAGEELLVGDEDNPSNSAIYVPVMLGEQPVGVLRVVGGKALGKQQKQVLSALADYVAVGVERERGG